MADYYLARLALMPPHLALEAPPGPRGRPDGLALTRFLAALTRKTRHSSLGSRRSALVLSPGSQALWAEHSLVSRLTTQLHEALKRSLSPPCPRQGTADIALVSPAKFLSRRALQSHLQESGRQGAAWHAVPRKWRRKRSLSLRRPPALPSTIVTWNEAKTKIETWITNKLTWNEGKEKNMKQER